MFAKLKREIWVLKVDTHQQIHSKIKKRKTKELELAVTDGQKRTNTHVKDKSTHDKETTMRMRQCHLT